MRHAVAFIAVVALVACAGDQRRADSVAAAARADSLAAIAAQATADSARRADSARMADSVAAAAAAAATTSTKATRSPVTTRPATKADSVKLSPNIGRDSVIRRPRRIP